MIVVDTQDIRTQTPSSRQPERLQALIESLKNLRIRINATHAHEQSLVRAAQGIESVGRELTALVEEKACNSGELGALRQGQNAFSELESETQAVLNAGVRVSLTEMRGHLNHAWLRASYLVSLLESGAAGRLADARNQ